MSKRKVAITVDEELVSTLQRLDSGPLSAVVDDALASEVERRGRPAPLSRLLTEWDAALGPVSEAAATAARSAFDDLDAVAPVGDVA